MRYSWAAFSQICRLYVNGSIFFNSVKRGRWQYTQFATKITWNFNWDPPLALIIWTINGKGCLILPTKCELIFPSLCFFSTPLGCMRVYGGCFFQVRLKYPVPTKWNITIVTGSSDPYVQQRLHQELEWKRQSQLKTDGLPWTEIKSLAASSKDKKFASKITRELEDVARQFLPVEANEVAISILDARHSMLSLLSAKIVKSFEIF